MSAQAKASLLLIACVGAALLNSCTVPLKLWVVPGSTADRLTFGLSESRKSDEQVRPMTVAVFPCDILKKYKGARDNPLVEDMTWFAAAPHGSTPSPTNRIVYGRDEHGLRTERGPSRLAPGCYTVHAYARDKDGRARPATLRIKVGADGKVTGK